MYNGINGLKSSTRDRKELIVGKRVITFLPHEFRRKGVEAGMDIESLFECEIVQNDTGGLFIKIIDYSTQLKNTLNNRELALDDFYKPSIRVGSVIRFRYMAWTWRPLERSEHGSLQKELTW